MNHRQRLPEPILQLAGAAALCAIALVIMGRTFLMAWAGDAVIHLRIAELLAGGHGFQFNLGEPVVATTSLLWTFILAGFFSLLSPAGVAHAVKILNVVLWISTVFVTAIAWAQLSKSRWVGWISAAILALNPGVFQNSLNGMEAILLALLQITLFLIVFGQASPTSNKRLPLLLVMATLAALTRPEGILFCLLLTGFLAWQKRSLPAESIAILAGAVLGTAVMAGINLQVSGQLTPDSGVARMAAGLRESILLGPVHIHPRSIVRLAAYLPLTIGLLFAAFAATGRAPLPAGSPALRGALSFSVLLVAAMLFFYTFIFGATHTIRYWIPFFPFVAGASCVGLVSLYRRWSAGRARRPAATKRLNLLDWAAAVAAVALIVWMVGVYAIEGRQRMREGAGYPHSWIVNAKANRANYTAQFLHQTGIEGLDKPIRLAVTEVQSRYFLEDDGSVEILSLDGRTAPDFARFLDPNTGLRRFDLYLNEMKPDLIVLEQLDPSEPILPAVAQALQQNPEGVILVDGYRFLPVSDFTVKYLHDE